MAIKQARVLVAFALASLALEANDIVEAEGAVIKELETNGFVDSSKAAVAYAKAEGAEVITLADPDTEPPTKTPEEIQAAIDAETERLASAPEAEKGAIQAGIDKLKAWFTNK